jgi:hypothetical protein
MSDALRQFEEDNNDVELEDSVALIEQFSEGLTDEQVFRLWNILQGRSDATVDYGPNFDIKEEVEMQIMAVRAMRDSVITSTGQMRPGVPARELKEVVTASNTLLQTLMKTHGKILSYDRQRAIEEAVATVMRTLPDKERATYLSLLEANLAAID